MLKISAVYFMWNPEICQATPSWGQDDLVLLFEIIKLFVFPCNKSKITICQYPKVSFFKIVIFKHDTSLCNFLQIKKKR